MIIVLIVLFTIFVIVGFFYMKGFASWLVGVLSVLLLALSMIALAYHDNNHWGMKQVTTTSTKQIYTAGSASMPFGLLIKQNVSGSDMFIYRASSDAADTTVNFLGNTMLNSSNGSSANKIQSFIENLMENHTVEISKKSSAYEQISGNTAQVVTKTTRWEFSSSLMKTLFGIGGEQGELVSEKTIVKVPKDTWLVLTDTQVQKLSEAEPKLQAQMEAELKANPAKAEQLAALQKNDPEAYAKMQVQQIKSLLGI